MEEFKNPSEESLDETFEKLENYFRYYLKHKACAGDLGIINNWMTVFNTVKFQEKSARNSLMILIFGQLQQHGYLKEPFIISRNISRNLNDILDEYSGLGEQDPKPTAVIDSSSTVDKVEAEVEAASVFVKHYPKLKTHESKFEKDKELAGSSEYYFPYHFMQGRKAAERTSNRNLFPAEVIKEAAREDESNSKWKKIEIKLSDADFRAAGDNKNGASKDSTPNDCISPNSKEKHNNIFSEINRPYSHLNFGRVEQKFDNAMKEETAKKSYKDKSKILVPNKDIICKKVPAVCNNATSYNKYLAIAEAKLNSVPDILRIHKELRCQSMFSYRKDGTIKWQRLKSKARKNNSWIKGFEVGAYRALRHLASSPGLLSQQDYLNGERGWRCYRRALLQSCSSAHWSMQQQLNIIDSKRQRILQRMSYVLRLKQFYALSNFLKLSSLDLQLLLDNLEQKYVKLANHLNYIPMC